MNNLKIKEKRINKAIDKLSNLSASYSQPSYKTEKIQVERNQLISEKSEIEKKIPRTIERTQLFKKKIEILQIEVNANSEKEEKFKKEIDEVSQETENLVEEIEKWQM